MAKTKNKDQDVLAGEVTNWPIEQVHPYPGNAKLHDEAQVKSLARAIQEFGFDVPIVVDGAGVIIKGHGRRMAALHLKMKYVPVIVRTDMTAKQANASRISDNRVSIGDVDTNILNAEIMLIAESDDGTLLEALGMSEKELEFMTEDLGNMDLSALDDSDGTGDTSVADSADDTTSANGRSVPIKDVLGFGFFDAEDAKIVARWLSIMRGTYEVETAKAMAAMAREYLETPQDK